MSSQRICTKCNTRNTPTRRCKLCHQCKGENDRASKNKFKSYLRQQKKQRIDVVTDISPEERQRPVSEIISGRGIPTKNAEFFAGRETRSDQTLEQFRGEGRESELILIHSDALYHISPGDISDELCDMTLSELSTNLGMIKTLMDVFIRESKLSTSAAVDILDMFTKVYRT